MLENSWEYAKIESDLLWTNATFKVKGLLGVNGLSVDSAEERNWIPLRWFVFTPTSFDADFTSVVEILDPFSTESPGYSARWYEWAQTHGRPSSLFFKWDVSDRSMPTEAEIMKTANPCRPEE